MTTSDFQLALSPRNCRILMVLTGVLLLDFEQLVDLLTNLAVRHADIVLGVAIVAHEGEETVVRDVELKMLVTGDRISTPGTGLHLQAGTRDGRRWGRPCCGWKGRDLRTSCR